MKIKTKVRIANELARELKGRPVLGMFELVRVLAPLKARSESEMRDKIKAALF